MATRSSAGQLAGGAKRGLNPPTERMKLGPPPNPARSAADPVIGNLWARRESTSTASIAAVPASKSMTPIASMLRRTRSLSADGSCALMRPSASSRVRDPNSRISARSITMSDGVQPADLGEDAEQITAATRREGGREIPDQRRRVAHRIAWEQQRGQRAVLQTLPQDILVERAIHADHAADAQEPEPERQRNRAEVLGGDEDDQRVAATAVGHARRDQAERLERDVVAERELHRARVEALGFVSEEEPAAGDDPARVYGEADAFGRLEPRAEIDRAQVAAPELQRDLRADVGDGGADRPDARATGDPERAGQSLRSALQRHGQRVHPQRTRLLMQIEHRAQPGAALDVQAFAVRPARLEVHLGRDPFGREDRRQEPVGAVGADLDAAVFELEVD